MLKLSKRVVDAARPKQSEYFIWCAGLAGFGVRIYPSGRKVFVAQARVGKRLRRLTIGSFGVFTVDEARAHAREIIRVAHEGRDPQREKSENKLALTVGELCDVYFAAATAGLVLTRFGRPKRHSTITNDEGRIRRHIKQLIGQIPANALSRTDVQRMVDDIASGKTMGSFKDTRRRGKAMVRGGSSAATRVAELLGGIYSWAEKRGHVTCPNPVRGIDKIHSEPRERILSATELFQLGQVLKAAGPEPAALATHLIALTGLRLAEACNLKWTEIDFSHRCLRLGITKTGRSTRALGSSAIALLARLPQKSLEWVFPNVLDKSGADLKKRIALLFNAANLRDARSHDLRRTFATMAAECGFSDSTIGELLGHARRGVTVRHYIRPPDITLLSAADKSSQRIEAALFSQVKVTQLADHRMIFIANQDEEGMSASETADATAA